MKKILLLILMLSFISCEHDEHEEHDKHEEHGDHHDDHGSEKVGEEKAITAVDKELGFKLSPEATKRLAIKTVRFEYGFENISKDAYVIVAKERALYRKRDGFYKLIDEHELTGEFQGGDEVVIQGIGLLRATDIFSTDESEYGHAH